MIRLLSSPGSDPKSSMTLGTLCQSKQIHPLEHPPFKAANARIVPKLLVSLWCLLESLGSWSGCHQNRLEHCASAVCSHCAGAVQLQFDFICASAVPTHCACRPLKHCAYIVTFQHLLFCMMCTCCSYPSPCAVSTHCLWV